MNWYSFFNSAEQLYDAADDLTQNLWLDIAKVSFLVTFPSHPHSRLFRMNICKIFMITNISSQIKNHRVCIKHKKMKTEEIHFLNVILI